LARFGTYWHGFEQNSGLGAKKHRGLAKANTSRLSASVAKAYKVPACSTYSKGDMWEYPSSI
jgi:hypothetical protein